MPMRIFIYRKDEKTMRKFKAILAAILSCSMILPACALAASAEDVQISDSKAVSEITASSASDTPDFSWDNATVYFLLTDRFRNGNTSNDHSYGRATDANGNPLSGWDTAPGTFHGGDFAGITQAIEEGYFNDLGVNAIWLSAPYEQIHGYCDSGKGFAHYSYHGYYVLDYTETDANFGTREEFQTLVDTAHEHGIRIIMDIVMNHSGYNTVADMETYNFGTLLPGASDFKYKLDGVSQVNDNIDFKTSADDWGRWWGNDWIRSGLPGYEDDGDGSDYTMSLTGLPDFRTESTKSVSIAPILETKWKQEGTYDAKIAKYGSSNTVTGYISSFLADWVRTYGVDGFRCDTAKHVDKPAWNQLKTTCVAALKEWRQNNPGKVGADWTDDFWMTGEAWDHGLGYDSYYSEGGFDSMINFDTCGGGALSSDKLAGKYQDYAGAINTRDDFNGLSFLSSHDEVLANQSQDMYYMGSAFLLLPGGVQIYYGDESGRGMFPGLGFDGYGGSGHSLRSDMNWDSLDEGLLAHWQKVGTFRNNHLSIGAGANLSLTSSEGVAFGRTYSKNGKNDKAAGVVGAGADSDVTVDVSELWEDGTVLVNAYDDNTAVVDGGSVTFNSGAHGTILIEEPSGGTLVSLKAGSTFETTEEVTVNLMGTDTVKISIDGGKKFMAKNGDTFTIGDTAYPGDTVKIYVEYETETGTPVTKTFSFKKKDSSTGGGRSENGIVHVYSNDLSNMNLYAWQGDGDTATQLTGAWPGTALSAKDDDGWYVYDLGTTDKYNIIINSNGAQSGDTTNLQGETWVIASSGITVKTYTDKAKAIAEATGQPIVESSMTKLKNVCRSVKILTDSDYTSATLSAVKDKVTEAEKLIVQGEDADEDAVKAMIKEVEAVKSELVLSSPVVTSMPVGGSKIEGTAACEAEITVTVDGKTYTAVADDITGVWSVSVSSLSSSSTAEIFAQNSVAKSATISVKAGNITNVVDKSALESKLAEAQKYTSGDYEQSAIDALVKVISTARGVYDEANATQSEVDAQVTALDKAIEKVKNSPITSDTDSDSDSDSDTDTDVNPGVMGDVSGDGKVSLRDATMIQQNVADIIEFTDAQKAVADMNSDGRVSLKDATLVQLIVAGIKS